jgi:hypothetical protein
MPLHTTAANMGLSAAAGVPLIPRKPTATNQIRRRLVYDQLHR